MIFKKCFKYKMSKEDDAPLRYADFTKTSFAIFGDREKYDKLVQQIGGKWNPRMKPVQGWYINKERKKELDALIRSLSSSEPADLLALSQQGIPLKTGSDGERVKRKYTKSDGTLSKSQRDFINKKKIYETLQGKKEIAENPRESANSASVFDEKSQKCEETGEKTHKRGNSASVFNEKSQKCENSASVFDEKSQKRENSASVFDEKSHKCEESEKTDEESEKTDEESEKTDDDPEKTDDDPEKTDDDPEKTDDDPEKTDDDPEKTDDDPEKTDDDPEKTDDDPEKSDGDREKSDGDREKSDDESESEEDNIPIEKLDVDFDKRIGNPEEKLLVQRRNKFITDYVNSDDEIDGDESKIMLARFKNYFAYYKTYARSPEKFDTVKTKTDRKKYTSPSY